MELASPDVREWWKYRTGLAEEWAPELLVAAKGGQRVSVVLPARNEQDTIGEIVGTVHTNLVERHPLVDEIIAVD